MPSSHIERRHSIAERTARILVFGFPGLGTLLTLILISPKLPVAIISCWFVVTSGSATIRTLVLSNPIPARLSTAATLTFAGNALTASAAVPSYITALLVSLSNLILLVLKNGAPARAFGLLVVVSMTE